MLRAPTITIPSDLSHAIVSSGTATIVFVDGDSAAGRRLSARCDGRPVGADTLTPAPDGDGGQIVSEVLALVDDQNDVINTLVDNMKALSGAVGGGSQYIQPLLGYLQRFGTVLADNVVRQRLIADQTGSVLIAVDDLLAALGFEPNNSPGFNDLVRQAMPIGELGVQILSYTPGLLAAGNSVLPPTGKQAAQTCSKGQAPLPESVRLFLRGSQVTLCRR